MDTITAYLDSLFASFPDNPKTRQAKTDMLANMRDYYRDLLHEGKSEESAIGAVMRAFGSVDELREDLGLSPQSDQAHAHPTSDVENAISATELSHFWHNTDQFATQIALGVLLCCISVALPAYTDESRFQVFGIIGMFLLDAIAVGLFIWAGTMFSPQKKALNGRPLTENAKQLAQQETDTYRRQFSTGLVIGIMICIGAMLPPILSSYLSHFITDDAGGALFLIIAGLGTYLILYVSINYSQIKRYAYATAVPGAEPQPHHANHGNWQASQHKHNQRARKEIALFRQVYWLLVLVTYFLVSFLFDTWDYSWLIFVIGGACQNIIISLIARRNESL
ncbi:permease prefix domain 1-containing protein [Lacticaseibacillus chiayiensis]|uniref:permease prefix domain 1-containing protein n=1 Tax=Lacticaseibacillus chiayiensis TaxID=2100821 RepID=UPI0010110640|nr:permease prefix domain 1-containing protein [Lacticaseibacillus chiayiensis]RXT54418.1 hypothetical protein CHT97_13225 [Lacticaseibacillus chiayiensis]